MATASSLGDTVRILHLIDVLPGTDGRCLHRLVRRTMDGFHEPHEHVLLEVGGGDRTQPELPRTSGRLGPSHALDAVQGGPLRRVLESWMDASRAIDAIHVWGSRSLRLRAACLGGPPTLATVDSMELDDSFLEDLHELDASVHFQLQVGSQGMANCLHAAGVQFDVQVRPFGIDASVVEPDLDRRAAWEADADTAVFGVIADPMKWTSLRSLLGVPARFAVVGRSIRIVADPGIDGFDSSRRWLQGIGRAESLLADDAMNDPAAFASMDVALVQGSSGRCGHVAGLLPILESLAASRPVLLGHGHPAAEDLSGCPMVFCGMDHDENEAARWLLGHVAGASVDSEGMFVDMRTWCDRLECDYASLTE